VILSCLSPTAEADWLLECIMSIFGKILAIFNVFAVVGVLVLMGMNYAKRQNWEYAVFRQDLMMDGLPLDNTDTDPLQQRLVDKIGPKTQQELFRQASPSAPVATQKAELDRVKGDLQSRIQGAGEKKKQIAEYARILMPMAETSAQRLRMLSYQNYLRDDNAFTVLKQRLLAAHTAATAAQPNEGRAKSYEELFYGALDQTFNNPPGPFGDAFVALMKTDPKQNFDTVLDKSLDNQLAQLQGQFDQMFVNAFNGGEGVQPGGAAQQRRTIARLLFNMVEVQAQQGAAKPDLNDPAYKRFFIVVGVKAAVEAVNDQAGILQNLAFQTQAEGLRERNLFAFEHRKEIDMVLEKKAEVDQHAQLLVLKKKEKETHETALAHRREDVKTYEEQLAKERQDAARNLEQLRKLSDRLHEERVKLRENADDNQKLEKQIRALEAGR
jgi:hypothetical protein